MGPVTGPGLLGAEAGPAAGPDGGAERPRRSSSYRRVGAQYSPGEERPLREYAAIAAVHGAGLGAGLLALQRSGRLPERPSAGDVALVAVATHKLSRLIAKDKVTSFLRAPFTRYEGPGKPGEVEEQARGAGMQLALGELLICPYCLAQWVATGLTLGLAAAPRPTRMICTIFAAHTASDFLQAAYRAAEDQA